MCQNKKHKLSFASLILCEISYFIIHLWSVQESISARFLTNKRETRHRAILPHVAEVASRWCTIIYLLNWQTFHGLRLQMNCSAKKNLMGVERIVLSVLGGSAALFLNNACGSQNDEDKDDHHNDTNYHHHFDVLPPVFPGNARGCSLERIRLKDRNDPSPIKIQTHTGVYNSGNKLT